LRWLLLGFLLAVALSRVAMRNRVTSMLAALVGRAVAGVGARLPKQQVRVPKRAPAKTTTAKVVEPLKPKKPAEPEVAASLGRLLDKAREEREKRNG
jgi:hypothetical protein